VELPLAGLGGTGRFNYCVIGAGPAGVVCGLKLASAGSKVLLLEGGNRDISPESQEIYEGDVLGDDYFPLNVSRLRFFGGSSNHWGGWCRPLDKIDFEGKGTSRLGRWPITKSDLDPFLHEASNILEIEPHFIELPINSELKQINFQSSPPVRFREKYYREILHHGSLFLCLNANAVQFETDGVSILSLVVQGYDKVRYAVHADRYILACGGIENSRLLLWSNYLASGGLIKNAQSLGRYWFEHPHFTLGEAIVSTKFTLDMSGPFRDIRFFSPTEEMIRTKAILNCGLRLHGFRHGVGRLLQDVACVAPGWADWAYGRFREGRLCGGELRAAWEQEPRYENHIALGSNVDVLGIPRIQLHWRKSELDLHTPRTMAAAFGSYLAVSNIGRLKISQWLMNGTYPSNDELAGNHHMGGTRMGVDPNSAVVDANCKLFGQRNLYIAGSSVFPSGGHANPTLTIIQLALRLSSYLKSHSF
jgi:hypothetical protein